MATVTGLDNIMRNLNKEIGQIKNRTQAGITDAALFIKDGSKKDVPVVTGNLRNSAFIVTPTRTNSNAVFKNDKTGKMAMHHSATVAESKAKTIGTIPVAEVGYTAVYAANVHENPRAGKTEGISPSGTLYRAPINPSGKRSTMKLYSTVGKWHWLQDFILHNAKEILRKIEARGKIK